MRVKTIQRYPFAKRFFFQKFIMSYLQTSRFLHARTSAREFNLINRFCQLINFAFNAHARGQRAAVDGAPRHCQFQVRGHHFDDYHVSSGTEKINTQ